MYWIKRRGKHCTGMIRTLHMRLQAARSKSNHGCVSARVKTCSGYCSIIKGPVKPWCTDGSSLFVRAQYCPLFLLQTDMHECPYTLWWESSCQPLILYSVSYLGFSVESMSQKLLSISLTSSTLSQWNSFTSPKDQSWNLPNCFIGSVSESGGIAHSWACRETCILVPRLSDVWCCWSQPAR